MAGEFAVMEKLFRLGHEPSLTLGNAKTVDIFTKSPTGRIYQVSVKAIRGGGKWSIGTVDYSPEVSLLFVLLHYAGFEDLKSHPRAWVLPAGVAMTLRKPWLRGAFAVYCGSKQELAAIAAYENAWHLFE
jgi:hypothetical protein